MPVAIAGLLASGPAVVAIEQAGEEAVVAGAAEFLAPFWQADDGYRLTNSFRYAIGARR